MTHRSIYFVVLLGSGLTIAGWTALTLRIQSFTHGLQNFDTELADWQMIAIGLSDTCVNFWWLLIPLTIGAWWLLAAVLNDLMARKPR